VWLNTLSLLVTVTSVPAVVPGGSDVRVGHLAVTVLPTGQLTSLDGTSSPSNSNTVVAAGSWGHVVCDAGAVGYSHTALAVAFEPPSSASYVAALYTIQVSTSREFPASASTHTVAVTPGGSLTATVGLPPPWQPTALRYVVRELVPDTAYYVRVGAAPPALPAEVTAILPRAVPIVFSAVGETGAGCVCAGARVGDPCAAAPTQNASRFTPRRPVIGTCVQVWQRLVVVPCASVPGVPTARLAPFLHGALLARRPLWVIAACALVHPAAPPVDRKRDHTRASPAHRGRRHL
jgi:hypothetical protein